MIFDWSRIWELVTGTLIGWIMKNYSNTFDEDANQNRINLLCFVWSLDMMFEVNLEELSEWWYFGLRATAR